MDEKIFVEGMNWYEPTEKQLAFKKGRISVQPQKFVAFLKANAHHIDSKGYFALDVMMSKKGNTYIELSTFKPAFKDQPGISAQADHKPTAHPLDNEFNESDLPNMS
jgi:hypothetical protein